MKTQTLVITILFALGIIALLAIPKPIKAVHYIFSLVLLIAIIKNIVGGFKLKKQ